MKEIISDLVHSTDFEFLEKHPLVVILVLTFFVGLWELIDVIKESKKEER